MSTLLVFDVILVVFGLYLVIATIQMKKSGEINSILLAPEDHKKVKDKKGFIQSIFSASIIFGITVAVLGIIGVISDKVIEIPYYNIVQLVVFLIVLTFFSIRFNATKDKFILEKIR